MVGERRSRGSRARCLIGLLGRELERGWKCMFCVKVCRAPPAAQSALALCQQVPRTSSGSIAAAGCARPPLAARSLLPLADMTRLNGSNFLGLYLLWVVACAERQSDWAVP
jgi:hypothetical protein